MTDTDWSEDKVRIASGEQNCSLCHSRVRVGDEIYPIMGKGWSHATCARREVGAAPVAQS